MSTAQKRFGIRVSLPAGDTMAAPHLLGPAWEGYRWYASAAERDRAFDDMQLLPGYYRRGDRPSQILAKVER